MVNQAYKNQVSLLLSVIPEVAKEECFALHGGTAINLFIREMPRLSVDIDLTYIPIEDRQTSLNNITEGLKRIQNHILKINPYLKVSLQKEISKLLISSPTAQVKVEVNQTKRGLLEDPKKLELCAAAQKEYDVFYLMQTVGLGQLYGDKICAALDRQHPRDLFDVRYLLDHKSFTDEIKTGFLLSLLSSNRPTSELINPNLLDQRKTLLNQFDGMSKETFTYEDFETTRKNLIDTISRTLTYQDKMFLINFEKTTPEWSLYDFKKFPSVQWKLKNLITLKRENPDKHIQFVKQLKNTLNT
jgi:predicted nucleotidyltransferase component of viral defense system